MKTLKTISISMMVLLLATFGLMAADIDKTANFTIGDSYNIQVLNSTSLAFPADSSVGGVDESGLFTSNTLEIKLDHNYDVSVANAGSAFDLDTDSSDYGSAYAVPATWIVDKKVADGDFSELGSETVSGSGSTKEISYDANVDTTGGDAWFNIKVKADRSGLDDPQGDYTANMDITVSDLS